MKERRSFRQYRAFFALLLGLAPGTALSMPSWQTEVMSGIQRTYDPIASQMGRKFALRVSTKLDLYTAWAERTPDELSITVTQALLDKPGLRADTLRMTICHEIGHLLGGSPRKNARPEWDGEVAPDGMSVDSSEGQADYYAGLSCFRRLVADENEAAHHAALAGRSESVELIRDCDLGAAKPDHSALICRRAAWAAFEFLRLVKDFAISFATPDTSIAPSVIRDSYPARQCRLDTFVRGAACRANFPLVLDFNDAAATQCPDARFRRPSCWFID